MKLVVQIPCLNEESTLPLVVGSLPQTISGIDCIEILVLDDGSTDATVRVARELGVHHIVSHARNLGLAATFRRGLDESLQRGADIIVNIDGDHQYRGEDIPTLIEPILRGDADMVIGDRQTDSIDHFSPLKKVLQRFGSALVRRLSNTSVVDAVSGFRAISRTAALKLTILNDYTYTVETILQSQTRGLTVASIPITTNPKLRESRLIRSLPTYLVRVGTTMLRVFTMYHPLRVFCTAGMLLLIPAFWGFVRFLTFYFTDGGQGHVQSLVVSGVLAMIGVFIMVAGVLADLIQFNRRLSEEMLSRIRSIETKLSSSVHHEDER
jgi:glycosyltransferase involved in cell wall biosynthesis